MRKLIVILGSAILPAACLAAPPAKNPFQATVETFYTPSPDALLDPATLPAKDREALALLKPGLTRAELDKKFPVDGGLQSEVVERRYLDSRDADGRVIKFEVMLLPPGLTAEIYSDPARRAEWLRTHRNRSEDVVVAVGKPYRAAVFLD
jgi:hypothetical protein